MRPTSAPRPSISRKLILDLRPIKQFADPNYPDSGGRGGVAIQLDFTRIRPARKKTGSDIKEKFGSDLRRKTDPDLT